MHRGSDRPLFLRPFLGVICCQRFAEGLTSLGLRCLSNEATETVGFYFSILLARWAADHLQEGLAKFGYRSKP
jgi:hypothetical protein